MGYTRAVHRRMLAFVVAMIVAAAPQMLLGCELACAGAAMSHEANVPAHSCHHESDTDTTSTTQVSGTAHACGHADDLPSATNTDQAFAAAPAILPVVHHLVPPTDHSLPSTDVVESIPLDRHFRITPLRI